ncbi:MAG: hypothetical protein ACJAYE_003160 [Candidatus Azotimanducaceae bacterium]|jgi:hypothetical protein
MKSTLSFISIFCLSAFMSFNASAAGSKSDALNECKSHLDELYQSDVRSKLKRIKKRGGNFEVKMKVSTEGERFNAVCAFADGGMTYSTDRTRNLSLAD